MGTVLPPWKLELIEKKRKRLEQEKAKEQEKIVRYSSIPEWKRNILYKRKGGQQEDPSAKTEGQANLSIDDQTSTNAKKQTEPSHSDGCSSKSNTLSSNEKISANERLRNGDLSGHSTVSSVATFDKQKQEQTVLSNETSSQEDSDSDDDNVGRVLYEHIKTPSELRRLYEQQVAKKKALEEAKVSKEISISNRAKSSLGFASDNQVSKALQNRDTTTTKSLHSTDAKPNGSIPKEDTTKQIQVVKLDVEESVQEGPTPAAKEITQLYVNKDNKVNDLQNGDESSSEFHVEAIRNKFGPSGFFRRRSASSDNLLKSVSEPTTPASSPKVRPSTLNKRWSMVSLHKNTENCDEFSPPSTNPLKRARSLSDVKGSEHNEVPSLKHRASVSHDIEHRIHELLHNMSVSDGNTSDEWDDDQIFPKETPSSSPIVTKTVEEPKERRASWFTNEEVDKDCKTVPITQNEMSLQNNTATNSVKPINLAKERCNLTNQKTSMSSNSVNISTKREVVKEKEVKFSNAEKSESFKHDLQDSGIDMRDESIEEPEKGPSVHKLTALFGSTIAKGSKSKQSSNISTKSEAKSKQSNQDTSNKSENKSSVKFPWMKKSTDDVNNKDATTTENKFPFKGSQNLKPIQKKYGEQKITGNMTLVIGGNKTNQSYNHVKPTNYSNSLTPSTNNTKNTTSSIRTIRKPSVDDDDEYITIIDVPDTTKNDDIEVSAIDIPQTPSPTPVSVIDMPDTKNTGVKVSAIDIPQDSDSDSDSGTTGSYDVNPGSSMFTFKSESIAEEEEEEEDIDDVPVSYFGDSTYMKVPEVIFESEREDVKSILSSPIRKRKRKNKVVFHPEKNLEKVHDYPSEDCLLAHYDQMAKEHHGLGNYQPTALQNVNLSVQSLKPVAMNKDKNSNSKANEDTVKITYSDEGDGFTNTSSSTGALLF